MQTNVDKNVDSIKTVFRQILDKFRSRSKLTNVEKNQKKFRGNLDRFRPIQNTSQIIQIQKKNRQIQNTPVH